MRRIFAPLRNDQSIATRLFLSAAAWSTVLLLVAGIFLVTLYRRNTEKAFDDRLSVYLRALVADMAVGTEEQRNEPGQLGDPQFDLAQSGWYWQVTRLDNAETPPRQSLSLSGATLPRLSDPDIENAAGAVRSNYIAGPDGQRLRMFERIIDIGSAGTFLIQVAASTEEAESQILRFKLTLIATFVMLALALVGTTALQVRYGLRPLRKLQDQVGTIRRGESERIEGKFPYDLAPLADELNLLISSNREVVERARTQVGNLAHALKTPLSVIVNESDRDKSEFSAKVREQTAIMRDQVTFYLDRARAAARSRVVVPWWMRPLRWIRCYAHSKRSIRKACRFRTGMSRGSALSRREAGFRRNGRQSRRQCRKMGQVAGLGDVKTGWRRPGASGFL